MVEHLHINAAFTHTVTVSKIKSHFLKKYVEISPEEGFLISRLFMILFMASVDIWLQENLLLISIFLIMELIASMSDDIEVSSGQLKRFDESVIDPNC